MRPLRIALFGGTFDPIHLGHTSVATTAKEQLNLDRVIFIPCRQSPHKSERTLATEEQRLDMISLATAQLPWAEISEIETCLPPPNYSWMTAECMREIFPHARLFWLIGEDQWQVIDTWDRPHHLAELVEFIVHHRGGNPEPKPGFRAHFVAGDHPASGTAIRQSPSSEQAENWLQPEVAALIRAEGIYERGD